MSHNKGRISGLFFMLGNHAVAEGAIAAGCMFFAAYPITPASEIAERMAERMPEIYPPGRFIQMEDEIGSIFALTGASLAGAKAMTATSSAGYNYMQEGIGYAVTVEAPCVIVDVPRTRQDIQPSHADVMQVKWGTSGDYEIICLAPGSVQEAFDLTIEAFNLAEKYRNPVVVHLDANIAHMRGKLEIPQPEEIELIERKTPTVPPEEYLPFKADEDGIPPMTKFGDGYRVLYTFNPHNERGKILWDPETYQTLYNRITWKITKDRDKLAKFETWQLDDADLVVIAYGSEGGPARVAVEQARAEGIKAGYLRLLTLWPTPNGMLERIAETVNTILVPEMNLGKYIQEVERICCSTAKVISLSKNNGMLHTSQEIFEAIRRN